MLNCVDLFSGAGGFSLAARQAGLDVRLAIENDKCAVQTYEANLCRSDLAQPLLISEDITRTDAVALRGRVYRAKENCDLILGGPPCQGFSTHRIKDAGVADARNDLIYTYFAFVRTFRPTAFLLENVPGMLWPRHREYLEKFKEEARSAGYKLLGPLVLDARDYGVPQRRKRVFILGVKEEVHMDGFSWPPPSTHGSEADRALRRDLLPWNDCLSAFRPAPEGDENDIHMRHSEEIVRAFENTPPNGGSRHDSGRVLRCHDGHDGHNDVYGRINPFSPGPTMTTACINPSKGRFVHPTLNHGITARQAARLQTFPDSFVFKGGLMAAGKQIGNAVPVDLARILITQLIPLLVRGRPAVTEPALSRSARETA
jgi:DNA (cytosine-5)-methyltransferase 1